MNAPFVLRWALAMAALRGNLKQASVQILDGEAIYVFAVSSEVAHPWVKRRERRHAVVEEGRQQVARQIRGVWYEGLTDDAEPAFADPIGTLEKIDDALSRIEDRG